MPYDPNASLVPSATAETGFTISDTVITFADFTNLTSYKTNSTIKAYRLSVTGGDVRYLWDADPTATEGHILSSASGYNTHDIHCNSFIRMRFIRVSTDATMTITPIHSSGENVWFDGYGLLDSVYSATEIDELLAGTSSVKETLEWAGTSTALNVLGTGDLLDANTRLVAVWAQASGTVSIIVGDEADDNRYVAEVALVAGQWKPLTLTIYNWDGTNGEVLVKPSASYTGTIKIEIIKSAWA